MLVYDDDDVVNMSANRCWYILYMRMVFRWARAEEVKNIYIDIYATYIVYAIKRIKSDGTKNFRFVRIHTMICVISFRWFVWQFLLLLPCCCCCCWFLFSPILSSLFFTHTLTKKKTQAFCYVSTVRRVKVLVIWYQPAMLLASAIQAVLPSSRFISFHFDDVCVCVFLLYFSQKSLYISACLAIQALLLCSALLCSSFTQFAFDFCFDFCEKPAKYNTFTTYLFANLYSI